MIIAALFSSYKSSQENEDHFGKNRMKIRLVVVNISVVIRIYVPTSVFKYTG